MGQQQLLLITLGIVIVGIATMSGISAYSQNSEKVERSNQRLIMLEIISKAKAWKATPQIAGGSPDATKSDPYDYSGLTFFNLGMTSTGSHGSEENIRELMYITSVGCFKLFPSATRLRVNLLDPPDCDNGSWQVGLEFREAHANEPQGLMWFYRSPNVLK
ncbi:MAG: hypothetical protein AAGI08_14315 [Bacteroidota bacterium]